MSMSMSLCAHIDTMCMHIEAIITEVRCFNSDNYDVYIYMIHAR